jgi:hypothetical protein
METKKQKARGRAVLLGIVAAVAVACVAEAGSVTNNCSADQDSGLCDHVGFACSSTSTWYKYYFFDPTSSTGTGTCDDYTDIATSQIWCLCE